MMHDRIVLYSFAGVFAGACFFFAGFSKLRMKRLIENTPTSRIRGLAMGLAEIYGKVVPLENGVLKSALARVDCVYYRAVVEEYQRRGKHSRWVKILDRSVSKPFLVEDDTGRVLVEPDGAEFDLPKDFEFRSGFRKDLPEGIKSFLEGSGLSFEGLFGINKDMRFYECCIRPGDGVYILGNAGDNPLVEDGTAESGTEDIMIQRGRGPFYISDRPEKEVLKDFRTDVYLSLYGGPALSLGSLFILLKELGII